MPTLFERFAARLAYWHARRVYGRFLASLEDVRGVQRRTLARVLAGLAESDYGRVHGLGAVRDARDLQHAAPLVTYEDMDPYMQRMCDGDYQALLNPGRTVHMFATSSGTTAKQKLIPVTSEFVRQYRRGWNIFGLKMLSDHPNAILRPILQSSGRHDERHTPAGVPCGAITGLLARSQKGIVRRFYVGRPEIAYIPDAHAKYYTLMRFGVLRDVAFAITANPATLIRMAETADAESENLLRDVRDGTLSAALVPDASLRRRLEATLRPHPERARALETLRRTHGVLRPRDYWQIEFVACWSGGSMGHYLERLAEWWGPVPVRDIGLLASEGRVSIPFEDDTPAGVLDTQGAFFEFIPAERWHDPAAPTLTADEIEPGQDYAIVLTNDTGLVRYRLGDVVRVRGRAGTTPIVEFLYRAGRVSSVAGEKLTENQAVEAVRAAAAMLGVAPFEFILHPVWSSPPFYQMYTTAQPGPDWAETIDRMLGQQNDEYASRRKSLRLGMLRVRHLPSSRLAALDHLLLGQRKSSAEQYKRPCLLTERDTEIVAILDPSGKRA